MRNNYSDTLLHLASQEGLAEVCRVLIKSGLDVNSIDKDGQMPRH
jgi:ankyrin repeat protein